MHLLTCNVSLQGVVLRPDLWVLWHLPWMTLSKTLITSIAGDLVSRIWPQCMCNMTVKKKNSFLQTKENNRAKPVAIVSNQKHTSKLSQLNCTFPLHLYSDLNCSSCSETHNQKNIQQSICKWHYWLAPLSIVKSELSFSIVCLLNPPQRKMLLVCKCSACYRSTLLALFLFKSLLISLPKCFYNFFSTLDNSTPLIPPLALSSSTSKSLDTPCVCTLTSGTTSSLFLATFHWPLSPARWTGRNDLFTAY